VQQQGGRLFQPFSGQNFQEMEDAERYLKRLERRDWWLWWTAVTVMLLLALTVIAVSLPSLLEETNGPYEFNLNLAIHALVGLVLLFNVYAIYQQWLIKRLRKQTSRHLQMLLELKSRAEEFHRLATRDPLTGLSNRRLGEERLAGEVSRSQRYGHPLSVLMLDLDHFKVINDQNGHAAGDLVLRTFAERLNRVIRPSDLSVRLGGDEFLVILPECPAEHIPTLLNRLKDIVAEFDGKKIAVSSSAGWAGYQKGDTPERLMERADKALYLNKRASLEQKSSATLLSQP
jgi:diguanylate cyclase (GGDEF)-like protein